MIKLATFTMIVLIISINCGLNDLSKDELVDLAIRLETKLGLSEGYNYFGPLYKSGHTLSKERLIEEIKRFPGDVYRTTIGNYLLEKNKLNINKAYDAIRSLPIKHILNLYNSLESEYKDLKDFSFLQSYDIINISNSKEKLFNAIEMISDAMGFSREEIVAKAIKYIRSDELFIVIINNQ